MKELILCRCRDADSEIDIIKTGTGWVIGLEDSINNSGRRALGPRRPAVPISDGGG